MGPVAAQDLVAWYEDDEVEPEGDVELSSWLLAARPSSGETRVLARRTSYIQTSMRDGWLVWETINHNSQSRIDGLPISDLLAAWQ